MKTSAPTTRRAAITGLGAGVAAVAGLAVFTLATPNPAAAAISSGAGAVAGGSLEGPNGPIQFSAFGSRLQLDDVPDPVVQGALAWHDAAGMEGEPLTIALVTLTAYGPASDDDNARVLAGTVSVNGEGERPFGLRLVEGGEIREAADSLRLVVGSAAVEVTGTPVPDAADAGFDYDVEGELTTGNVEIVTFV